MHYCLAASGPKEVKWEAARLQQEEAQLDALIEHEVASTHGFLPDLLISIHLNARKVLGSTTPGCYFPHPVNASCHDITETKSLPYSAKKVLGLGGKFIVTPSYTTAKCLMLESGFHPM